MSVITIDQMVQREVNCCLSSLVSTLASGAHAVNNPRGNSGDPGAANLLDMVR